MATIQAVCERWANLDFDSILEDSIEANETVIIDANVNQMKHGIKSDGSQIGIYHNPEYATMKFNQNQLAGEGNVDLILEGGFTQGIVLGFNSDNIKLFSEDEKNDDLTAKYGDSIFGLTPENQSEVNHGYIKPTLLKTLRGVAGI